MANVVAAPELLTETFRALNGAVRYCVLRGADWAAAGTPPPDVDLLVDVRDVPRLGRIVSELGFAPLASWGYGGHRFFVAFEKGSGRWLKLDVVTSLRYGGPSRSLAPGVLSGCLDRRQCVDAIWRPDVVDALLGLMLHAVLDKGTFNQAHQGELVRLRGLVKTDAALLAIARERFVTALGPAMQWDRASEAIERGAWESILRCRRQIAWEIFRRAPLGCARRWFVSGLARILRRLLVSLSSLMASWRAWGRTRGFHGINS